MEEILKQLETINGNIEELKTVCKELNEKTDALFIMLSDLQNNE